MSKYSFLNDYSEGAHPRIIDALTQLNIVQQQAYGNDDYSSHAKELIKGHLENKDAEVFFVSGATQANLIIISSTLRPHESIISSTLGHITTHETGAIEATGHKINTIEKDNGKLTKEDIIPVLIAHDFGPHVVKPRMIYISNSTEIGTIYTKKELKELYEYAHENNLYLFMDGARMGSGLSASNSDLTLADVARYTDVFTIGGTKNGALLGEAIVIVNDDLKSDFSFHLKQKGAMLSKGRLLGIQFQELFKDNLYFELAQHANNMAMKISKAILANNHEFLTDSKTNQLFPILPNDLIDSLEENFIFYRWKKIDGKHTVLRLVTSWATQEEQVDRFITQLSSYSI
ncbi:MAG: threonine aldolase [Candidatus Azotimanducaceae bacterium]|jgi:threonine aldolase